LSDEIQLVLPAEEEFRQIAHLVLGGLGARNDLTYEHLEDLQVALDALLACRHDDGEISVVVRLDGGGVQTSVGPFAADAIDELQEEGDELGLRRVLETVCDSVTIAERNGGSWVELSKQSVSKQSGGVG
jgi:anti-sigma regulatory factor (Ser/Thr protein kinase)